MQRNPSRICKSKEGSRVRHADECRSTYEYTGDERDFQGGRCDSKQDGLQHERNALCAAVNCTSEATGLSVEVESEVEVEEMFEGLSSDFADGALANVSKDGVQELAGKRGTDASKAIYGAEIT